MLKVKMNYIGAATFVLQINDKIKIGVDPALSPLGYKLAFKKFDSVRIKETVYDDSIFNDIDMWLITHNHEDHLDGFGKKVISSSTTIICDERTKKEEFLENDNAVKLKWGAVYTFNSDDICIRIKAIPAYHANSFIMRKIIGKVNGYLINIIYQDFETNLYITGDTVFHKDITNALNGKVDVMIANLGNVKASALGGPWTMNLDMLKQFEDKIKPTKIIPIHIDDFSHFEMNEEDVELNVFNTVTRGEWTDLR